MRLGVKEVGKLVKINWQVKQKNFNVESINSQLQKTKKYHSDMCNYIQIVY